MRSINPIACQGFDPAHATDPIMVAAHDLSHTLACDSGAEIRYRELGALLRADIEAGAPLPIDRDIDVLAGNFCEDEPADKIDSDRVDRLFPRTVARINEEF